ncbi:MAG TPA: autotransporter domain-containing protein [Rhizomicrobium sp.]|nr:autotransporter domain-containing protein [Rhizomicrobium sp.]
MPHQQTRCISAAPALIAIVTGVMGIGVVAAQAATPIDTNQLFYLQSNVGTTVLPDFQGGTLRLNVNGATDTHAYNVENFSTNTIDEFGDTVTFTGGISGTGPLTFVDSVGGGNVIVTGADVIGGAVTIDTGATLTWGNGTGGAFLIGPGNAVTDNGALVMDFGAGNSVVGQVPISGTGSVTIHTGILTELGPATYTGGTTIDAGGVLQLASGGGTSGTVTGDIVDNGLLQFNYAGPAVTAANAISGSGNAEVQAGTVIYTGLSAVGGTVTIDSGATMQWGNGNSAFLVGGGNAVVDNGALVMNFGGGGIGGSIPISGTGTVELVAGSLNDSGVSTYTGSTMIDSSGLFLLSGAGSIADSSDVIDNGVFDISQTTAGTSITSLTGSGGVSLGAQTLTLTNASGTFSGVLADGGLTPGIGGGLTIAGGTETLTGTNTYTGDTTINVGATLVLGNGGGSNGTVASDIVDNGLLQFDYSGPVTFGNTITGSGSAEVVAGTLVVTGANAIGGAVTIDPGATMQWGDGNPEFLVGGTGVVDNGALVMDFGGGGVGTSDVISGTGNVTLQSGSYNTSATNTYTGSTTIDAGSLFLLTAPGSIADSSDVIDNGVFDIGSTAGTSITTLEGSGGVSLGAQILTLTNASGVFSGVLADGSLFAGGTGGALTVAGGTETLTGTNTYTGDTTINAGATLQLGNGGSTGSVAGNIVDSGLVTFDYGGSVTAGNTISGGGGVTKIGTGELFLTGTSTYTGATLVNAGILSVNGSLVSAVTVNAGGTLKGNGTIGGLSVNSGGTVAPGNSIGTLHVAGNVSFVPGSTYQVEVNNVGMSDLIAATGTATLTGGIVQVLGPAGSYGVSETYTILTASSVTGTFAGVTSNVAFYMPSLTYKPAEVDLTLLSDATLAQTPNEKAVANAIQSNPGVLGAAIGALPAAQIPAAFDATSGEIHASVRSALLESGETLRGAVLARLNEAEGAGVWGRLFGTWGGIDGDGNAARLNTNFSGMTIGVDTPFGGGFRGGVEGGYGQLQGFIGGARNSSLDSDSFHAGVYGGYGNGPWSVNGGAIGSWGSVRTERDVRFGSFSDTDLAKQSSRTTQAFLEAAYDLPMGGVDVAPFVNGGWIEANTGAFAESGGAAALSGTHAVSDETFTTLGLRVSTDIALSGGGDIAPNASIGWQHGYRGLLPARVLTIEATSASFTVFGVPLDQDQAVIDAGVTAHPVPGATLSFGYEGILSGRVNDNGLHLSAAWDW